MSYTEFPTGRRERISVLESELDAWLGARLQHVHSFTEDADEATRLVNYALFRVAQHRLEDYVRWEPFRQPPFPEYDEGEEARVDG